MKSGFSFKSNFRVSVLSCAFLVLALAVLIYSCSDNTESPQSSTPPSLSISISCIDGAPEVHVTNDGGPMEAESLCRVLYEDGTPDSIILYLNEGQSITCRLSNMHGGVTVGIEGTTLEETAEDCLVPAVQEILEAFVETIDLTAMIPVPLTETEVLFCHYDIYLENITHDFPVVSVDRIAGGMDIQVVYANFIGDIRAETSDLLCVDFTGSLSISSIVYDAQIMFVTGPGETVGFELVNSEMTLTNLDIQIDGVLDFLVGWIVDFFDNTFAEGIEYEIENAFNDTLEPTLSDIVVEEISCE